MHHVTSAACAEVIELNSMNSFRMYKLFTMKRKATCLVVHITKIAFQNSRWASMPHDIQLCKEIFNVPHPVISSGWMRLITWYVFSNGPVFMYNTLNSVGQYRILQRPVIFVCVDGL